MAPEQARGEVDRLDERADVFALGSILCEILTGQPAFTGRTVGRDPAQGGAGRPGRRPGPARRLRGRRRAGRPGPATAWPPSPRTGRATPARWPGGSRPTWPACRSGSGAAELARAAESARAEEASGRPTAEAGARAAPAGSCQVGLAASVLALAASAAWARRRISSSGQARGRDGRPAAGRGRRRSWRPGPSASPTTSARWRDGARPPRRGSSASPVGDAGGPGSSRRCDGRGRGRRSTRPSATAAARPGLVDIRAGRGRRPATARPPTRPTPTPSATPGSTSTALPPPRRGARIKARPAGRGPGPGRGAGRLGGRAASGQSQGPAGAGTAARRGPRRRPRPLARPPPRRARWPDRTGARPAAAGPGRRSAQFDDLAPSASTCWARPWPSAGRPGGGRGRAPPGRSGAIPGDVWVNYDLAAVLDEARPRRDEAIRYLHGGPAPSAPRRPTSWPMRWTKQGRVGRGDRGVPRPGPARGPATAGTSAAWAICLQDRGRLERGRRGRSTRPSPPAARRSGSSPTTPWPTTTSASP